MSKAADVDDQGWRWDALNPEILALIFIRIQPSDEMVKCVPFVCKPWMEVVAGPYCWRDINLLPWCRRRYYGDSAEVDQVVEKLVKRSNYSVQQLSTCDIRVPGFLSAIDWYVLCSKSP
ncbi:hypothetical protein OSB04_012751 [Centaurea solstitialis]|uniref:F-box domain-containing protein n=1 Tax=Centaurea solstitialis TaxID=347529 RepID=A0AA38WEV8_9ASTR|nr:hypothetical protein OSB04_012751 [Centaurea solstitialis]